MIKNYFAKIAALQCDHHWYFRQGNFNSLSFVFVPSVRLLERCFVTLTLNHFEKRQYGIICLCIVLVKILPDTQPPGYLISISVATRTKN